MSATKRYLITGGAGFIGSAITRRLLQEGFNVRIFDNESRGTRNRLTGSEKNLEFIQGDIRNFDQVEKACRNIDTIIHLAFINGTRFFYEKPDLVLEVGVKGILNVLDAAKKHGIGELYLASSSEVYQTPPRFPTPEDVPYSIPTPFNPRFSYAGGKIISELLALYMGKSFLKKSVIFRPHNVYGPDMGNEHVIPELLAKLKKTAETSNDKALSVTIQGSGKETRAFIYIDDFVDALFLLLEKGKHKEIYNIGTEEEISIASLVTLLTKIWSKKIVVKSSKRAPGSTLRRCPDITKLKKLGFLPKISLEEGLKKTALWYNA